MIQAFIYGSAALLFFAFLYAARDLRRLLYLLFGVSLVEGMYINYFYPQQFPLVIKDILVLWIYGVFVAQGHLRGTLRRLGTLVVPLGLYAAVNLLHVFNPNMNNVLIGLVGLRVSIFYIPLVLVAMVAFRSADDVWTFLRFTLALAIPVCLYGIYQDFGGASHIASLGPGYVQRGVAILYGGGHETSTTFRTLSTFTYSSSFSLFILLMLPFAWVVLRTATRRWKWTAVFALLLLFAAQISSGGRQALVFSVMIVILTELFYEGHLLAKLVAPVLVALALVFGFFLFGTDKLVRYESILNLEEVRFRYETYFVTHNLEALRDSPLGNGTGAASTAARHVGGESSIKFRRTETFISKVAYETGILGVVAIVWSLIALLVRLRLVLRSLRDRRLTLYVRAVVALGLTVLGTSFNGWPLDVPPMNALFWLFSGLALAAGALEQRSAEEPAAAAVPLPAAA